MEDSFAADGTDDHAGWRLETDYPHPDAIIKYGWEGNLQRGEYNYFGPAPNHAGKTNYLFADGHTEDLGLWPWSDHKGTDFHPVRNPGTKP
jgi:prepilin-type processing-associated H-X9-DG protein